MARGTGKPSTVFADGLNTDKDELVVAWQKATQFEHTVLRGTHRESALRDFLAQRLPSCLRATAGEIIDFQDQRSGQVDIVVYDSTKCPPLMSSAENVLLPAEGALAVVEVKSTLNASEWKKCVASAAKIRKLMPYKEHFVGAKHNVDNQDAVGTRCFVTVFAYETDLEPANWLAHEWRRYTRCCDNEGVPLDVIDRVVVLSRGLLNCPDAKGRLYSPHAIGSEFQTWYLNLVNFLLRENSRREPVDWQQYGPRNIGGWFRLDKLVQKLKPGT